MPDSSVHGGGGQELGVGKPQPRKVGALPDKGFASVILFVAATLVSLGVILFVMLSGSLGQEEEKAESSSRGQADILEAYLRSAVHEVDLVMLSAVEEIGHQQETGKIIPDVLNVYLARQQARLPQIISLRVTDATGNVRFGPGVQEAAPTNVSDRSFFMAQRDNENSSLVFGAPVMARISKRWVLPLSRRLTSPDGSFGGIVYANIALDYFSQIFSKVDTGPNGTVTLFDAGRSVIARHPSPSDQGGFIGRVLSSPQIVEIMNAGKTEASFSALGTLDGITRAFSIKKLENYPLYISVGLAELDYLASWRQQTRIALATFTVFAVILFVSSALLLQSWKRQGRTMAELVQAQAAAGRSMIELRNSVSVQRATAARLELVLKTAAEGIVGIDPESKITFANPEAAALLGYCGPEEMLGLTTIDAFKHRLAQDQLCTDGFCAIRQTLQDGEVRRACDESFEGPGGKRVPVEYAVAPLRIEDRIAGAALIFHDVSERDMEAELKRSNTELEQFAYAASHDLREPLRMVSSFVTLLEKKYASTLNDEAREFIGFARDGAQRMDRMIHHLLDYSRIGRSKEPFRPVDLNLVMKDVLQDLGPSILQLQASVETDGSLPVVLGDREELSRLLQNLVANALKYRLAERRTEIRVKARIEGRFCTLSVQDNGIGIPAEHQDRIFAIFQRLHTQSQYEGTGIGLALCKKIVERHGGRIWVESQPGEGSAFFITLPLAPG